MNSIKGERKKNVLGSRDRQSAGTFATVYRHRWWHRPYPRSRQTVSGLSWNCQTSAHRREICQSRYGRDGRWTWPWCYRYVGRIRQTHRSPRCNLRTKPWNYALPFRTPGVTNCASPTNLQSVYPWKIPSTHVQPCTFKIYIGNEGQDQRSNKIYLFLILLESVATFQRQLPIRRILFSVQLERS